MTPYVSVALYRRADKIVFKPPRKERPDSLTQARKSATRHWSAAAGDADRLVKVIVMREFGGNLEISERAAGNEKQWVEYQAGLQDAATEPHLAAALSELGLDPDAAPPPVPDILVINGFTYRRDI